MSLNKILESEVNTRKAPAEAATDINLLKMVQRTTTGSRSAGFTEKQGHHQFKIPPKA